MIELSGVMGGKAIANAQALALRVLADFDQPTPLAGVGRHPRLVPRMTGEGDRHTAVFEI